MVSSVGRVFGWIRKYKFLILGLVAVGVTAFAFTWPGRCIVARCSVEYYDFTLKSEDFEDLPFDPSSCPALDGNSTIIAKECILRLGKLEMSGSTIIELAELGDGVVPLLVEALQSGIAPTRYQAALALGLIRHPASFEPLVATLVDAEPLVRMAGAIALGNLEDERACGYLHKCLKFDDNWARFAAAKALAHMECFAGLAALSDLMDDQDVGPEARKLMAEYSTGNGNRDPLIDSKTPVPVCIRNLKASTRLFNK